MGIFDINKVRSGKFDRIIVWFLKIFGKKSIGYDSRYYIVTAKLFDRVYVLEEGLVH